LLTAVAARSLDAEEGAAVRDLLRVIVEEDDALLATLVQLSRDDRLLDLTRTLHSLTSDARNHLLGLIKAMRPRATSASRARTPKTQRLSGHTTEDANG
jgi:hypothetical protein